MYLDTNNLQILSTLSMIAWKTGKQIRIEIEEKSQKTISIGVLYRRLDRLEEQGLIEARENRNTSVHEFRLLKNGDEKLLEYTQQHGNSSNIAFA